MYMLNKLELTCQFVKQGCKAIIRLDKLTEHTINCSYNNKECEKCSHKYKANEFHDCVSTLLDINTRLKRI